MLNQYLLRKCLSEQRSLQRGGGLEASGRGLVEMSPGFAGLTQVWAKLGGHTTSTPVSHPDPSPSFLAGGGAVPAPAGGAGWLPQARRGWRREKAHQAVERGDRRQQGVVGIASSVPPQVLIIIIIICFTLFLLRTPAWWNSTYQPFSA